MRDIKNKGGSKLKRLGIFFILFIILIIILNSARNLYQKKKAAQETLARMEQAETNLENRDEFLKESIEKSSTEEGVEFEIRKRLNVAKVGEGVAIIVEESNSASTSNLKIAPWQKVKNFFNWLFE